MDNINSIKKKSILVNFEYDKAKYQKHRDIEGIKINNQKTKNINYRKDS